MQVILVVVVVLLLVLVWIERRSDLTGYHRLILAPAPALSFVLHRMQRWRVDAPCLRVEGPLFFGPCALLSNPPFGILP